MWISMDIPQDKLNKTKELAEEFYKSIGEIHCPYLKDSVSFNVKGLDHIKFKMFGQARPSKDQYMRLRLLKLAPIILKQSHTLQEIFETNSFEKIRSNQKWNFKMLPVRYFAFVSIINNCRIKIIIKQVDNGKLFFWSIVPFWKMNRVKNCGLVETKKIFHDGDLETQ